MEIKNLLKNITKGNKYIGNILNSYKNEEIIQNNIIKELVKYHPTKKIDTNNVEWFKMLYRKPYNNLSLHYKYKNNIKIDDISWKLCIRNLFDKYNKDEEYIKDVLSAFRNEIFEGTRKKYYIENTKNNVGICDDCLIQTTNIDIDHYPQPYKLILNKFMEKKNINLYNINVYENNINMIKIEDKNLSKEWLYFHDNIAEYRLLCSSCNKKFGSYGY